MTDMRVPMSSPDIGAAERDAVARVMDGSYLSNGPVTQEFEEAFARVVGRRFAVSVSSGTSGLHLSVIGAGIGPGDLVITSPFSFVASANVVLYEGAIPVFVDVESSTGNLAADQVAEAVEALKTGGSAAARWLPPSLRELAPNDFGSRLKAILPIHVFGQAFDADQILAIAANHSLQVIEDACEALGTEHQSGSAGTFGTSSVFAFYPNKQMTTGEGGMIVTDREQDALLFRSLRNQGRDVFDAWLSHSRIGFNYRMDELSAAVGLAQVNRLQELVDKRAQVASWYNESLAGTDGLEIPHVASFTTRMSWFVYVVRVAEASLRGPLLHELDSKGIPSRPYFPPIHLQPAYRDRFGWDRGSFVTAEDLGARSLALPFSGVMPERDVELVSEEVKSALKRLL